MKIYYRLTILFFIGSFFGPFLRAQSGNTNMKTIEVNKDFSVVLKFNETIDFVITGNNPKISDNKFRYYDIFQSGKMCFIKGNDSSSPATSLHVALTNGDVFYGVLQYGNSQRISYDFTTNKDSLKSIALKDSIVTVTRSNMGLEQKVKRILSEELEYSMFGIKSNRMLFQITNIRNDEKYTYFKIVADNQSGSDYNIDNMLFKYQEGKKRGSGKNAVRIEERIMAKYEDPTKTIKAYSKVELAYVIPLFTVGENGNLIIQMMESSGTRNPKITILGEDMLKVKTFDNK